MTDTGIEFPPHLIPVARQALTLMDLTSLGDHDTDESVTEMVQRALSAPEHPAAVCVWPQFVPLCLDLLKDSDVRVATVTNFPKGEPDPDAAARETKAAVAAGAHEVDVVFPYTVFKDGEVPVCRDLVTECKAAVGDKAKLKVILETGVLKDRTVIRAASEIAIEAGADFIKTSTGKTKISASPDSAEEMLRVIKESGKPVGFKPSGGIRSVSQAWQYLNIARKIMGDDWVSPETFRFGASGLLSDILLVLGADDVPEAKGTY